MAHLFRRGGALCGLLALHGCGHVDWHRALYDGQRAAAAQCRSAADPTAPPCATLPAYDAYQTQRARMHNAGASTVAP